MDKFLNQYEILFKKANTDLRAAKILLQNFDKNNKELDTEVIYFHLQQCAEKLIKSLLDYNNIKYPKIHDLRELISLLNDNNIQSINKLDALIKLNYYAVEGRYSILHDNLEGIDIYIEKLELFISFLKRIIN